MENKRQSDKLQDVYHHSIIHKKVTLEIKNVGANLRETLEKKIGYEIEGKCITEGYIKNRTVSVISFSSGCITLGNKIIFDVVFECDICLPVEGMKIDCVVKNVTKAGIRAEVELEDEMDTSPLVIFIARDHHIDNKYYNDVVENSVISIRVIGQRFELNDKYITIIAELLGPKKVYNNVHKKTQKQRNHESVKP